MKKIILSLLFLSLALLTTNNQSAKMLKTQLEAQKAKTEKQLPENVLKTFAEGQAVLAASEIEKQAYNIGDSIPEVTLENHLGKQIALHDLLKEKNTVLTFYRGGWCPYCNIHLRALQQALPEIQKQGAQLIAVSPDPADRSLSTKEKQSLEFTVLTDHDNQFAQTLDIAFQIPEAVKKIYLDFGLTISPQSDAPDVFMLPLAATYIVNTKGEIIWAFVNIDYTQRSEPEAIIDFLKTI